MDIAIVIGGNAGIGLAVARKLIILGFRVYAIAEDFSKTPFAHKDFLPLSVQMHDSEELKRAVEGIIDKGSSIYMLINALEKTSSRPFNSMDTLDLQVHLTQQFLNPILLTRLLIDSIKQVQGFIINIVHENLLSPLSCAVEEGLTSFYESLFEGYCKYGVNVTNILVQSTASNPVNCEMVANTVDHLIRFKGGNAVTKISVRAQDSQAGAKFPQITPSIDEFKEIQLPPKSNFPPEQERIPTQQAKRRPKPQVSRDALIIQREKKVAAPKKRAPRKSIQAKPSAPAPKISRETVIIPREKKTRVLPVSTLVPAPVSEVVQVKPLTSASVRIRRGRPSAK